MNSRVFVLAACLALTAHGAAQAQLRLAPDWAEAPDGERLTQRYPEVARRLGLSGRVLLSCRVAIPTGVLQRCAVIEETPKALGFGAAAMAMTRDFQMRPPLAPGDRDPDDIVRIPIRFKLPETRRPAPLSPDPARLASARRIVETMQFGEGVRRQSEAEIRRMTVLRQDGLDKPTLDAAAAAVRGALVQVLPAWRDGVAAELAMRMSPRDLAAAAAFTETPAGRAYLQSFVRLGAKRDTVDAEATRRARAATREAFCARLACKTQPLAKAGVLDGDDPPLPIVTWARRPTPEDLHRAWPLARAMDVDGIAALTCLMGAQGAPEECRVVSESPAGLGVGAAALSVSDRYRLPAAEVTGGMVGRKVLVMTAFVDVTGRSPYLIYEAQAASPARRALAVQLMDSYRSHWAAPAWREALAEETEAMSVLPPEAREVAAAALTAGYETGDRSFRELLADLIATELDEPTLRAALAFETGDGAALRRAMAEASEELDVLGSSMQARVAEAAGVEFCRTRDCGPAELQASGESSAPSTRTP